MLEIIPIKWRPRTFDEVVGQDHVVSILKRALEKGRIVHGYLFSGTRGVGKTSVARILAKALNCEKGPTPNPCLSCENCIEVEKGISRDVIEIDAASHTGVDEIREIIERARFKPFKSRFKVYIIDEVHMLSQSAFNALLKTLEEPPEHVVFILATTEPRKIPETILSRLQKYFFKRIPEEAIVNHLRRISQEEKIKVSEELLKVLAKEAEGSLRDAEALLEQVRAIGEAGDKEVMEMLGVMDHTAIASMVDHILDGKEEEVLALFNRLYTKGFEPLRVLKRLVEEATDRYIKTPSDTRLEMAIKDLLEAEKYLNLSTMQKPIMEFFLVKACRRKRLKSIEEIIKKLELVKGFPTSVVEEAPPPSEVKEEELEAFVKREFPQLFAGDFVKFSTDGKRLLFTVKGSEFFRDLIEDKKEELAARIKEHFGVDVEISVEFEKVEKEKKKGILLHPLVKDFIETFEGRVIEVKEGENETE